MAKIRSPGYPAIGLKEAIQKAEMVYSKDYQNRVPKAVIAGHMGYKGLSGASLPILAALNQYGLLEGRGDETRVSDLALRIFVHEPGEGDRLTAIRAAAFAPELFLELAKKFPDGKGSDAALRAYLLMQKFLPAAADTVIRAYRETIELLKAEEEVYKEKNPEASAQVEMQEQIGEAVESGAYQVRGSRATLTREVRHPPNPADRYLFGKREEKNALDEGEAMLVLPEKLSPESVRDLAYWLEGILHKERRRAGLPREFTEKERAALLEIGIKPKVLDNCTPEQIAMLVGLISPMGL